MAATDACPARRVGRADARLAAGDSRGTALRTPINRHAAQASTAGAETAVLGLSSVLSAPVLVATWVVGMACMLLWGGAHAHGALLVLPAMGLVLALQPASSLVDPFAPRRCWRR